MKSVLLVDDEIDIQVMIADFLRNYGLKVEAYANGKQANDRLKSQKYDLIITDIRMPEEDGFSLVYKIRNYWKGTKNTPIIIISGATQKKDFDQSIASLRKHNILFLQKPFEMEEFIAGICESFGLNNIEELQII
ncbi:MAG: response regulator [Alphaproteobacteria bacterium]|nr:response regulator [Alphaproteobacteria bacterium]